MGNSLSGKKRIVKVMKIDGTTLKLKPPTQAERLLRDYPGYNLLDSEEVKRLGIKARPLAPDALLLPGKLYFLVELPRVPDQSAPRRAWSGALRVGAKERLESLVFARRTMSDISVAGRSAAAVEAKETKDGAIRLKLRLPKAEVERLMQESRNGSEAVEKIAELCAAKNGGTEMTPQPQPPASAAVRTGRKEKRARFAAMPDEIIA